MSLAWLEDIEDYDGRTDRYYCSVDECGQNARAICLDDGQAGINWKGEAACAPHRCNVQLMVAERRIEELELRL